MHQLAPTLRVPWAQRTATERQSGLRRSSHSSMHLRQVHSESTAFVARPAV